MLSTGKIKVCYEILLFDYKRVQCKDQLLVAVMQVYNFSGNILLIVMCVINYNFKRIIAFLCFVRSLIKVGR